GRIVGVAEAGDEIGYDVEGQDEIGERAIENGPRLQWRFGIDGAVVGGEKLVQEGNAAGVAAQLAPEALLGALLIALHPVALEERQLLAGHGRKCGRAAAASQGAGEVLREPAS